MVSQAAVARVMGGIGAVPGRETRNDLELARAVRDGLPFAALERLIADGVVSEREMETLFIPRRTLFARRQKGTLSREQSDIVARIARIQALADKIFDTREIAYGWLRHGNGALAGQVPLTLLDTEEGGRLVEAVLWRIVHGIVE